MIKNKKSSSTMKIVLGTALLTAVVMGIGFYVSGAHFAHQSQVPQGDVALDDSANQTLWTCGMHPWIITKIPGQCPICGMDLVMKSPGTGEDENASRGKKKSFTGGHHGSPGDP